MQVTHFVHHRLQQVCFYSSLVVCMMHSDTNRANVQINNISVPDILEQSRLTVFFLLLLATPRDPFTLSEKQKEKKNKNKKSKLFAFICLTCEPFFCVFCRCWFHSWFSSLLSQHNTPTNTWQQAITRSAFQKQMRYKNRKSQKVQLQHGTHGSSGVITVDRLTPVAVNIIRQGRCLISQFSVWMRHLFTKFQFSLNSALRVWM